jgi:hypothetical protein
MYNPLRSLASLGCLRSSIPLLSSSSRIRSVHKLAAKPVLSYKIPELPDDDLIRIKKKGGKKVQEPPPPIETELKAVYGPQDLRRWPRESEEDRAVTRKILSECQSAEAVEEALYNRRLTLHWDDLHFGLNLALSKAKEEVREEQREEKRRGDC